MAKSIILTLIVVGAIIGMGLTWTSHRNQKIGTLTAAVETLIQGFSSALLILALIQPEMGAGDAVAVYTLIGLLSIWFHAIWAVHRGVIMYKRRLGFNLSTFLLLPVWPVAYPILVYRSRR